MVCNSSRMIRYARRSFDLFYPAWTGFPLVNLYEPYQQVGPRPGNRLIANLQELNAFLKEIDDKLVELDV